MKYQVVTTFNQDGYRKYGKRMIETFLHSWPQEVNLVVYAENTLVDEVASNLLILDLGQVSSALTVFKNKWQNIPKANGDVSQDPVRSRRKDAGKGFKWDAVRFSHKVYSIFHAANQSHADWLIWMDADIVCHSPITIQQLDSLCPQDAELCFLGRRGKFSECGLYAMNMNSNNVRDWLKDFQQYYDDADNGIFTLAEWHDSFVFDAIRQRHQLVEHDWSSHLITGEGHPLVNSDWGAYLDHLKGKRKDIGRSLSSDLKVKRKEAYWQ